MANREKGEVTVELDGASYTLCMDMNAMVVLEEHFSTSQREVTFTEILERIEKNSVKHIRAYLWASFLKHYPEMTLQDVNDLVQKSGGVFAMASQFVSQLSQATQPDPDDVKALGLKHARPRKAQARRDGIGVPFGSKRAASA